MEQVLWSAGTVSAIVGFILSFLIERIPGLRAWWAQTEWKELCVAVGGAVVVAVLMLMAYNGAPIGGVPKVFVWDGVLMAVAVWVEFLVSTQAAYMLQKGHLPRRQGYAWSE